MYTEYQPERINLRMIDQIEDDHFIEAEVLTKILSGFQKVVFAIAKDELQYNNATKIPKEVKSLFSIRCGIPNPGSYVLPIEIGSFDKFLCEKPILDSRPKVCEKIWNCFDALNDGQENVFDSITDRIFRKQALTAFRSLLPETGARWRLGISGTKRKDEIQLTGKTRQILKRFQENFLEQTDAILQTVTGYLVKMDFDGYCITLKYPPTQTELKCYYADDLEVELFENRRELLQVTGNVTYEKDCETPKKIADVESIQFIDLSDFVIDSFSTGQNELHFKEPLILTPQLTESCQFMTLQNPELGIDVMAQTRDELWEELLAELKMQWNFCALQPDEKLGKEFIKQKNNLLAVIEEEK